MTGPEIDDLWKEIIEGNGIGNITPNRIVEAMQTLIEANEEFQRQQAEAIEGWIETLAAKDKEIERLRTVEANLRGGDDSDGLIEARALAAERLTEIERLEGDLRAHRGGVLDDAVKGELKELREERDKLQAKLDKKVGDGLVEARTLAVERLTEIEKLKTRVSEEEAIVVQVTRERERALKSVDRLRTALAVADRNCADVKDALQAANEIIERGDHEFVDVRKFTPEQIRDATKLGASVIPDSDPFKSYDGIEDALVEVLVELGKAVEKNPRFNSYHEGWAVLFEEVDELWDEVREKRPNDAAMRLEARQVAAMALRFMVELLPPFWPTKDATT